MSAPALRHRHADLLGSIASSKDRAAFAELFAYFAPRVKSYLKRLGAEDASAEEIAQEVLVTCWRKAETFDRNLASPSTWIFRIARNRRIDVLRRTPPKLDPDEPMLLPEPPPAADTSLSLSEREQRVRQALSTLPSEQRDMVMLAFYEGLSHGEIAERTRLPLGTVKSRLRLAYEKLRHCLDDLGAETL